MLILILAIIMSGLESNSARSDFCDCDNSSQTSPIFSSQFNFSANQKLLFSETSHENETTLSFPTLNSVVMKTKKTKLELSDQVPLDWVKTLVLCENNFTTIPEFVRKFTGVQSLDLSRNNLESIDIELLSKLNLRLLNVSANNMSQLNSISSENLNNLTCLDLSKNILSKLNTAIELPSLQYLNLSYNNLKLLNVNFFNNLKLLQYIDVSRNKLVRIVPFQLPNLVSFLISGNNQLGKSRDVFLLGSGRKIQTLDASRTGLQQVPAILTHSIRHLLLSKNLIQTINSGDLDSYPLLNSLDVTSNNINFIEEDSLGRLEFLSVLYLTDNQLKEIPKRLPEKLKVLRLDINKIEVIRKKDLQGLNTLEELFLNDNNVTVISEGAFSELTSLVRLDLSRNPIINLQSGIFVGPLSLEILHLASIKIAENEDIPFPLSVPEHLIMLNLSSSSGLAHQFLSDTATLMAAKRLEELDLTGGNLAFIRQDLQFFLPQLKSLHTMGNHFNDSQINWLKSWLCIQDQDDVIENSTLISYHLEFSNTSTDMQMKQTEEKSKIHFSEGGNIGYRLTGQHGNKDDNFPVNEVHHNGVLSEFSQNLFSFSKKYSSKSQEGNNEIVMSTFHPLDNREDSLKWKASTGEISMYKSEKKNYFYQTLFLVISVATIIFSISVFSVIRFIKNRPFYADDIEATSLPTISDIW